MEEGRESFSYSFSFLFLKASPEEGKE